MFCPRCRTEYREGVTRCPDCDVELAEELPPPPHDEAEWVDLVPVLETGDASLLMVAKSLLGAEKIAFFAEGEGIQELLGAGRMAGSNLAAGPVRLSVRPEDAQAAQELLAHLQPLKESEEPES